MIICLWIGIGRTAEPMIQEPILGLMVDLSPPGATLAGMNDAVSTPITSAVAGAYDRGNQRFRIVVENAARRAKLRPNTLIEALGSGSNDLCMGRQEATTRARRAPGS